MTSNLEQLSFFERRLSLNLSEKSLAIRAKETGRVDSSVSPLVGEIGRGILLLLGGVHREDTEDAADLLAAKCAELRIFPDEQGKMNLSAKEIDAHALVVSQFTLYGDCHKGRRPNYMAAAGPENATELYDYFVAALRRHVSRVETGVFGAVMQVELVNDGPVTLILER